MAKNQQTKEWGVGSLGAGAMDRTVVHLALTPSQLAQLQACLDQNIKPTITFSENAGFRLKFADSEHTGKVSTLTLAQNVEQLTREETDSFEDFGVITKRLNFDLPQEMPKSAIRAKQDQMAQEKEAAKARVLSNSSDQVFSSRRSRTAIPTKKSSTSATTASTAKATGNGAVRGAAVGTKSRPVAVTAAPAPPTVAPVANRRSSAPSSIPPPQPKAVETVATTPEPRRRAADPPAVAPVPTPSAAPKKSSRAKAEPPAPAPPPPSAKMPVVAPDVLGGALAGLPSAGPSRRALRSSSKKITTADILDDPLEDSMPKRHVPLKLSPIRRVDSSDLPALCPPPKKIETYEEFKQWREMWLAQYGPYADLFAQLQKNRTQFKELGNLYQQGKDKSTALKQVQELYDQRREDVTEMRRRYEELHKFLVETKKALNDFVTQKLYT